MPAYMFTPSVLFAMIASLVSVSYQSMHHVQGTLRALYFLGCMFSASDHVHQRSCVLQKLTS
jgi:hypothetical protein